MAIHKWKLAILPDSSAMLLVVAIILKDISLKFLSLMLKTLRVIMKIYRYKSI